MRITFFVDYYLGVIENETGDDSPALTAWWTSVWERIALGRALGES